MKPVKKDIPYAVYGSWEVWPDGTMKSMYRTPSGRESPLEIYPETLSNPDLLLSLFAERTVENWNDFMEAFFTACQVSGTKSIKNFQTAFE